MNQPTKYTDPTGLLCNWNQGTGQYSCYDSNGKYYASGNGYAGNGACINNPQCQNTYNQGPLPRGCYKVVRVENQPGGVGNYALRLMPRFLSDSDNNNRDLQSFLIHGDNSSMDQTASNGCPIMPLSDRRQIPLGEIFCVN